MPVLRIEHSVPDYAAWKKAFDNDPVGRKRGGVRRHQVSRPLDDPRYVMIDLEFDTRQEAEAFGGALRNVWRQVEGRVMADPKARLVEVVESQEY